MKTSNSALIQGIRSIVMLSSLTVSFAIDAAALKNQLVKHASPYLAMHGSDPVQWQDWNETTVKRALKENKLIYISSGYFSCHWCHVMQRESYKNNEVAKILNRFFIPVKVDRELNPALDARLIDFVEKTQGQAGWPLNVFITPEGYPLVGMTYVPSKNFIQILNNLSQQWNQEADYLKNIAKQATEELLSAQLATMNTANTSSDNNTVNFITQQFLSHSSDLIDEIQGGFGEQNKFPSVPQLLTLLNIATSPTLSITQQHKWQEFLTTTLDSMAQQGLNDQVNGGFYRYTVDPNWQIPHFEKMLYDNAQLAILYFEAAQRLNIPYYRDIAVQTLDFLQTDMKSSVGVIAASLSAVDEQGIEGGYYVWQQGDLEKYLNTDEYKIAREHWKLVSNDTLESGYHLIQISTLAEVANKLALPISKVKTNIHSAKLKLRKVRAKKYNPIDNKPVAAWLGLALHAFTIGAKTTQKNSYLVTANKIFRFINKQLWKNNTLYRSVKLQNKIVTPIGSAGFEDYAFIASGVYEYAQATNNVRAKQFSLALAQQAWKRFYKNKGWFLSEKPLIKYTIAKSVIADSPLPSPSAVLLDVSFKLKNQRLKQRALESMQQDNADLIAAPFWYASQIDVLRRYGR